MVQTAEDIRLLNEKINHSATFIDKIHDEIGKIIVGQSHMLERLLIGLLSNGHILLEGVPGLAKNAFHKISRQHHQRKIQPHTIYARSVASGCYRHHDLQPAEE